MKLQIYNPMKDVEIIDLDNGLRIFLYTNEKVNFVKAKLVLEAGSNEDEPGKYGTAHFLEHMLSENFRKSRNIHDFKTYFSKFNGYYNGGATSLYSTTFSFQVLARYTARAMQCMFDHVFDTQWGYSIEDQRLIILREFAEEYCNTKADVHFTETWNRLMGDTKLPVESYVMGTAENIASMRIEDLKDFYDRYYRYSNAFLVVAGNISREKVETIFGSMYMRPLPKEPIVRTFCSFTKDAPPIHYRQSKEKLNPGLKDSLIEITTYGNHVPFHFYIPHVFNEWAYKELRTKRKWVYSTKSYSEPITSVQNLIFTIYSEKRSSVLNKTIDRIEQLIEDPSSLERIFNHAKKSSLTGYYMFDYSVEEVYRHICHRGYRRSPGLQQIDEQYEKEKAYFFEDFCKDWKTLLGFRRQTTLFDK